MATYKGIRKGTHTAHLALIYVDGKLLKHIERHSPNGFNWSYGGSGPADAALSILTHHLGSKEKATKVYQRFKREVVACFPVGDWVLSSEEIDAWIRAQP